MNIAHSRKRMIIRILLALLLPLTLTIIPCLGVEAFAQNTLHTAQHSEKPYSLSLLQATPVVTDTSGYQLRIRVQANRNQASTTSTSTAGRIFVTFNAGYTFVSRTDMQLWAQGSSRIPTAQLLAEEEVPAMRPGESRELNINVPADKPELKRMVQWGPKPLRITFQHGSNADAEKITTLTTFLTRANVGMQITHTPPLNITPTMTLLAKHDEWANDWQNTITLNDTANAQKTANGSEADQQTQHKKPHNVAGENSDKINPQNTQSNRETQTSHAELLQSCPMTTLTPQGVSRLTKQANLLKQYRMLEAVSDQATIQAAKLPIRSAALMQPSGFDISAWADDANAAQYRAAGVSEQSWDAHAARYACSDTSQLSRRNTKQDQTTVVAWQHGGAWTMQALAAAQQHGYNTVIATRNFDPHIDRFVMRNSVYNVTVNNSTMRVLYAQPTLSMLANGNPTSSQAVAEHSQAGRLNRLIAQSAFYQMEQPYASRHILIAFEPTTTAFEISAAMRALQQAPWLSFATLRSLTQSDPINAQQLTYQPTAANSAISTKQASKRAQRLRLLAEQRHHVTRFVSAIVDSTPTPTPTHQANDGDAQALAKQNAKLQKRNPNTGAWTKRLTRVFDTLSLREISMLADASHQNKSPHPYMDLVHYLFSNIRLLAPKSVTAVSETASMPVTISNAHPYPIRIYLTSLTDSMEIVTVHRTSVTIPANSQTQVTLPIRVTTSSQATARLALEDRNHQVFSQPQSTKINSTLRISDKSGMIIIMLAFVLASVGLWRQFTRKKDPDE